MNQPSDRIPRFDGNRPILPQLRAGRLNAHARALEFLRNDYQRNARARWPRGRVIDRRIAAIVSAGPNGEADFATNQYWLKIQHLNTTTLKFEDETSPGIGGFVIGANVSEDSASHGLTTDGTVYVDVRLIDHRTLPPLARWYFSSGGVDKGQYYGEDKGMVSQNEVGFYFSPLVELPPT